MDLRSRNKFPSQEKAIEQSLTDAGKTAESDHEEANVSMMVATAQEHLSDGDLPTLLQGVRNGSEALCKEIHSKTAELNQSISGLKTMLDKLSSRVAKAEERLGTAEDQLVDIDSSVIS